MELSAYKVLVQKVFDDPEVIALCEEGDRRRSHQTHHDLRHLQLVRDVAVSLAKQIEAICPNTFTQHQIEVIIATAAYLHDIGSGIDPDNHAAAGALWARKYLHRIGYLKPDIQEICRIIACHRSEVVLKEDRSFRKADLGDACWAVVVIADKAVGDESRVRGKAFKTLTELSQQDRMCEWPGNDHDRINFAIKKSELVVDGLGNDDPGAIILKLRMDERVAKAEEVCTLYGARFHACGKGAQYLGFLFRIEFNGERYYYDKTAAAWRPVDAIDATM
jgi:hypothetical protein